MSKILKSVFVLTLLIAGTTQADLLVNLNVPELSGGMIANEGSAGGIGVMDTGVIGVNDEPYNVESKSGYSLNFNGTIDSRVDFGTDFPGLNVYTNRIVVAAWVKISDFSHSHNLVMASSVSSGLPDGFAFYVVSNRRLGITFRPASQDSLYAESGLALVGDNEWTHIAAKIDIIADTISLYINGEKLYVKSVPGANQIRMIADTQLTLNRTPGVDTSLFNGRIDDIRIYNNDMTDEDIAAIMSSTPNSCGEDGTVYLDGDWSGPDGVADCYVDIYDLEYLATHWLGCSAPVGSDCN